MKIPTDKPTSRRAAIRARCIDCCGYEPSKVTECPMTDCPLWEFRMGKDPYHTKVGERKQPQEGQPCNRKRAIRAKCLDCCLDSDNEVRLCPADTCPLWEFRLGNDPYRKPPSEKQRELARMALAKAHEKRMRENPAVLDKIESGDSLGVSLPTPTPTTRRNTEHKQTNSLEIDSGT